MNLKIGDGRKIGPNKKEKYNYTSEISIIMEIIVFIKITFTSNQVTTISISVDLYVANHTESWMVYHS